MVFFLTVKHCMRLFSSHHLLVGCSAFHTLLYKIKESIGVQLPTLLEMTLQRSTFMSAVRLFFPYPKQLVNFYRFILKKNWNLYISHYTFNFKKMYVLFFLLIKFVFTLRQTIFTVRVIFDSLVITKKAYLQFSLLKGL